MFACFNQYVVRVHVDNNYLFFKYSFVYAEVFSRNPPPRRRRHDYLTASVQWEGSLEDEAREAYSFRHSFSEY